MLEKIKTSLLFKSLISVFFISLLASAIIVTWYWRQISLKTSGLIEIQQQEITESLKESLIQPLRFHNVTDVSRVLSSFVGRSVEWAIVHDNVGVPLYTVGNVPDINEVNKSDSEINLSHDFFNTQFEIKDGNSFLGRVFFGLKLTSYRERQEQEKRNLVSVIILSFIFMALF